MQTGWRYRLFAVGGATLLTLVALAVANAPSVQSFLSALPLLNNLDARPVSNGELVSKALTTLVVILAALWPVFKPRPRRILDTVSLTEKRLFLAATALATLGYFDWSSRLPRLTLITTVGVLAVVLPLWFVTIRRQPRTSVRAIIVGDDRDVMETLRQAASISILGYVAPSSVQPSAADALARAADGGSGEHLAGLPRLGGLSRLDDVLVEHDVDTVLLAFDQPDRQEFFGALSTCHQHGVRAQVHREHADTVLVSDTAAGDVVDTDIEPWDWQDHVLKRLFDVAFAAVGLLVLSPVIALIAVAIKLDSSGSLLYSQRRTAEFGETFTVYKFRSMIPEAEAESGARLSEEDRGGRDPRVTRVGYVLRATHLDEIPQLWSVLVGDMSVVGPRPERPELDADIEATVAEWRSRWFVRPGLTGLAQINGVTGHDPERKLRYDVEYIRRQSFWFDLKIVVRQLWLVAADMWALLTRDEHPADTGTEQSSTEQDEPTAERDD